MFINSFYYWAIEYNGTQFFPKQDATETEKCMLNFSDDVVIDVVCEFELCTGSELFSNCKRVECVRYQCAKSFIMFIILLSYDKHFAFKEHA